MKEPNGSDVEELPYEQINDMILELLEQGGGRALLSQSFDLHIDEKRRKSQAAKRGKP